MTLFDELRALLQQTAHIGAAIGTLTWDQEVMMPKGGAALRAQHISTLVGMSHEHFINQGGPLIEKIAAQQDQLTEFEALNFTQIHRQFERMRKLPKEHVMEVSKTSSQALHAWVQAREQNSFPTFQPFLQKLVDLKIQEAEYLGYEENPYDALIDQYEPEMRASQLKKVFEPFKAELRGLLQQIMQRPQVEEAFLNQPISQAAQLAWTEAVAKSLGYDFEHGRQDISVHPFTLAIDPTDVRITTRVDEHDLREILYSTVHEAGHAIYEQGLPVAHFGLPVAEACSLSIHESQSRLWENNVARSLTFWEHFFPQAAALYPDHLAGRTAQDLFRATNLVTPSLIRISSDELSYHFHVILRTELEDDLINRRLEVKDLPAAWNAKVKEYLGLDVPSDSQGVLQDIHWSHGSIGYFPTYSLGSFYAAQFMDTARQALPGLEQDFQQGQFSRLKAWLNTNIHAHGRMYSAEQLCQRVTGKTLDVTHFIAYAKQKYGQVYNIQLN